MAKARSYARRWQQARQGRGGDVRRNLQRFLTLFAALPSLLAGTTWAAKWDIVPTLSGAETYTDNVSLTPDASKQADWVTQVIPGISIAATGARLQFKAIYAPEVFYYAQGSHDNQVLQRGNAAGTAELAEKLLFIDAGARVDQYDTSLQGPLTTSNVNTTGNRTTVRTYYASPYLRHDFGSDVQAEARFTESVANSDDESDLSNSTAQRVDVNLKSGAAYKVLTWNLGYVREAIDYENAQDTTSEVVTAKARRLITPTIGLLAQVGYDYYNLGETAQTAEQSGEGPSWSLGFDWTPSPRTKLVATAGHRFYGNEYLFNFGHQTRLTAWAAGYTQSVTTSRSEFFTPSTTSTSGYLDTLFASQYPDPADRQKAVGEFIARTGLPQGLSAPTNFFSNQLFLVKKWQASVGILGVRNVLIANVYWENSDVLVGNLAQPATGDFATSSTITQTGVSFLWNWRITPQNAWNLGAAFGRNEFPDINRTDNLSLVRMGITRQFQPRLSGSLNYRRQQNNSNQNEFSYTENAVFATAQLRF